MTDKVLTNLIINRQIMESLLSKWLFLGGFGKRLLSSRCSAPQQRSLILSNSKLRLSFEAKMKTFSASEVFLVMPKLPAGTIFRFMESSIWTCFEVHAGKSTQRLNSLAAVESSRQPR